MALLGLALQAGSAYQQGQAAKQSASAVKRVSDNALGFARGQQQQANQQVAKVAPQFGAQPLASGTAAAGAPLLEQNNAAADITDSFNKASGSGGGSGVFKGAITAGAQQTGDTARTTGRDQARLFGFGSGMQQQGRTLADLGDFDKTQGLNRDLYMSGVPGQMEQAAQAGRGTANMAQIGGLVGSGLTSSAMWNPSTSNETYEQWLARTSGRKINGSVGATDIRPTTTQV